MSKQVNFEGQERVDLPDMAVVTSYAGDELRKLTRYLVSGESQARVLRGFLVEPEDPGVSPRVKVRLDFGGAELSSFVGALALPGGDFDFGQLGGGHDAFGAVEGAAQLLLDFTGQPPGSYDVKIRATLSAGQNDNRAFWNPVTEAEFVQNVATRVLLRWELAFSGHADPDWVLVGQVAWGGSSVAAADVIDARDLALEGRPRAEASAALRWSHPDQAGSAAALLGDFDRDQDRSGAAGVSALWAGFRALGRQVQDLKGGREGDLRFDWFSRVFPPAGGALDAQQTKSLRSVDTVTFTCADGVTDQGDFNGLSALYDCFAYIASNSAALPRGIDIVVKSRAPQSGPGPVFTWPAPVVITEHDVRVRVLGGNYRTVINPGAGAMASGLCELAPSITGTQVMLTINYGSLDIEGLLLHGVPDTCGIFSLAIECSFRARRCAWGLLGATGLFTSGFALRCSHQNLLIEDCIIAGVLWLGGRPGPGGAGRQARGHVRRSIVQGLLNGRHFNPSGFDATQWRVFADGLRFEDCLFLPSSGLPRAGGMLDLSGSRDVSLRGCLCVYSGDQDFVTLSATTLAPGVHYASKKFRARDCAFVLGSSSTHLAYIGVGLLEGTGWAVKSIAVRNFGAVTAVDQLPEDIDVQGCTFECEDGVESSPDAGAVALFDSRNCQVRGNEVLHWTEPPTGSVGTQYLLAGIATASGIAVGAGQHYCLLDNFVGRWAAANATVAQWGDGQLCCVFAAGLISSQISGNVLSAVTEDGVILDASPDLFPGALLATNCGELDLGSNHFLFWRSADNAHRSTCVGLAGLIFQVRMYDCVFQACGGKNVVAVDAGGSVFEFYARGCDFFVGQDDSLFNGAIHLNAASFVDEVHCHDCTWDYDDSGSTIYALHVGSATAFSVVSNWFRGGAIVHDSLGGTASATSYGYGLLSGQTYPNNSLNFVDAAGYL